MLISVSNEQTVTERRRLSKKLLVFMLFSTFALLSLVISSTLGFSAKLDGHPQARAQAGVLARVMLRDVSQRFVQDEEADCSSPGPDTDQPPFATAFSASLPAVSLIISLEKKDLATSSSSPLRSTPLAPRAPPAFL